MTDRPNFAEISLIVTFPPVIQLGRSVIRSTSHCKFYKLLSHTSELNYRNAVGLSIRFRYRLRKRLTCALIIAPPFVFVNRTKSMNKFLQNCDELPKAPATGLLPAATAHPSAYFPCSGVLQKNAPLVTAAVPWARHGSRFTKSFEETAAWLSVHASRSAVSEFMRVEWHTVGGICKRVYQEMEESRSSRFNGLVNSYGHTLLL